MFIYLLVTVFLPVASFHAIIQEPIIAGVVEFLGIPLTLLTCDYATVAIFLGIIFTQQITIMETITTGPHRKLSKAMIGSPRIRNDINYLWSKVRN